MQLGLNNSLQNSKGRGFKPNVGDPETFSIEIQTDKAGVSGDNQFQFTGAQGQYDVEAYQEDEIVQSFEGLLGEETITLPSVGVYELRVNPIGETPFNQIKFDNGGDKDKLLEINSWGDIEWQSFERSFFGCSNLVRSESTNINTSNVTNMSIMFYNCSSLTSLDLSGFDTSNVTNMRRMFQSCSLLTTLDVSGFNTSNVTNMEFMFRDCSSLTSIDVSGFDTSNVTSMQRMFQSCSSLTSLDLSGFNTSNVMSMGIMFYNCSSLTDFNPSGFNIVNVTDLNFFANSTNMSTTNYDNLLVNWEAQLVNNNLSPNFGNAQYTAGSPASDARQRLIDNDGWTITDGGAI